MLSMQKYAAAAAAGAREYAAGWREWHIAGSWHFLYAGEHHNDMCCAMMIAISASFHNMHKTVYTLPPESCTQPQHMGFMSNTSTMSTSTVQIQSLFTGP